MPTPTHLRCVPAPTEPLDAIAISPSGNGLPRNSDGSASATCLFEACSAFTRVPACMFARSPKGDLYAEYFNAFVTSCAALVASGRATDWPGGIRTHWRAPAFAAYWHFATHRSRMANFVQGGEDWECRLFEKLMNTLLPVDVGKGRHRRVPSNERISTPRDGGPLCSRSTRIAPLKTNE